MHSDFVFFKQKTAYEMRISDWSSDVCSSDLSNVSNVAGHPGGPQNRSSCRGSVKAFHRRSGPTGKSAIIVSVRASGSVVTEVTGMRSEERGVGRECVSTCRFRWSPYL